MMHNLKKTASGKRRENDIALLNFKIYIISTITIILIYQMIKLYLTCYSRQISQSLPSLAGSPILVFNCNSISDCVRLMGHSQKQTQKNSLLHRLILLSL